MIVCIDTNVLVQAAKTEHPLHAIFLGWFQRKFLWAISNDIITEYEEMLTRQSGRERWRQFSHVLDLAEARGDLLLLVRPTFQFHVITIDPDDNKFTDCAITAEADFVITEDAHFSALIGAGYKTQPITPDEFILKHLAEE